MQKTEGDVEALREDLIKALGMEQNPADVVINRLNNHIIVKVRVDDTGISVWTFFLALPKCFHPLSYQHANKLYF